MAAALYPARAALRGIQFGALRAHVDQPWFSHMAARSARVWMIASCNSVFVESTHCGRTGELIQAKLEICTHPTLARAYLKFRLDRPGCSPAMCTFANLVGPTPTPTPTRDISAAGRFWEIHPYIFVLVDHYAMLIRCLSACTGRTECSSASLGGVFTSE